MLPGVDPQSSDGPSANDPSSGAPSADAPQAVPALTLVVGSEEFLADRTVARIVAAARRADPTSVVHDLAPSDLQPGALGALLSPSLFGDRTVVILRRTHELSADQTPEVAEAIREAGDDVVLIVVHSGAGNRAKAVLEAARKPTAERPRGAREITIDKVSTQTDKLSFVKAEVRAAHRTLSEDGARALLDAIGSDLRELANACSQLVSDTDGTITDEVVRRYYDGHAEVTSFKVADAAVEGRTVDALSQLRLAMASGVASVLVTSALASSLRALVKLGGAPRGARQADLARDLGIPPWKVDVIRRQLRGWTGEGLAEAIRAVAEADLAVKGGVVSDAEAYALEKAVVTVARAREAAY